MEQAAGGPAEEEMEVEEQSRPVAVRAPHLPSAQEKEEHELTGHVCYRNWCPICLACKGLGQGHREAPAEDETAVPTILCDYAFMGQDDNKCLPMLCAKDRKTKRVAATFVQSKGLDPYAQKYLSELMRSTGYRRIVNKSDGETSIVALKTEAAVKVPGLEASPVEIPADDHQALGEMEVAVREIKSQVRLLKASLEMRLGRKLHDDDPVLAWMPRHGADLINRYRVGPDGKTPDQRRTGKRWRKPAIEYGEKIFFREAGAKTHRNALQPKMQEGRYIGHHGRTGALLAITPEGVKRGTGLRRLPAEDRWTTDGWEELKGYPWDVQSRRRSEVPAVAGDEAAREVPRDLVLAPPEM